MTVLTHIKFMSSYESIDLWNFAKLLIHLKKCWILVEKTKTIQNSSDWNVWIRDQRAYFGLSSTFSCDSCQMWYLLQSFDDLCAVEFQSMYLQKIVTIIYKLAKCGILRNFQVECLHSCKRWWNKREWWTALIKNSTTNDGNFDILLNPNMC